MIYGLGIDLTDIDRIRQAQEKRQTFAGKVLTPGEYEVFERLNDKRRFEYLAGRFSAKESYGKALGTGIGKEASFQGIEILNDALGNPYVNSHPKQDELIAHVSISHTDTCVMTEVILESKK